MEAKEIILTTTIITILIACSAAAQNVTAQGGHITPLNILSTSDTEFWQGIPGRVNFIGPLSPTSVNATGGDINRTDIDVPSPCTNPTSVKGFILFSNSSTPPVGLTAGNLTKLNKIMGNPKSDSAQNTFTSTTNFNILGGNVNSVPTTHTIANCKRQNFTFREGYFNDAADNIVIGVEVDFGEIGFNTSRFDFQAMLPVFNKSTTEYFISTDLDITCPEERIGGGGGWHAGYCLPDWICGNWSECRNGTQTRECHITGPCRGIGAVPAMTRKCGAPPEAPIGREQEIIEQISRRRLEITAPETIFTYAGGLMSAIVEIYNPNAYSVENLEVTIHTPTIFQQFLPLHKEPRFYTISAIPIQPIARQLGWAKLESEKTRLDPGEMKSYTIQRITPLIKPRSIKTYIETLSGPVSVGKADTTILTETKPFTMWIEREGQNTEVQIIIDNRGKKSKKAEIELNMNKGKSSAFTEVYTLELPADQVSVYGYTYLTPFQYDTVTAKYGRHKEVI